MFAARENGEHRNPEGGEPGAEKQGRREKDVGKQ
jgi:hypothetical protein